MARSITPTRPPATCQRRKTAPAPAGAPDMHPNRRTSKPFGWYGGKAPLVPLLLDLMPRRHTCFVEVCGGSAALLFGKEPSAIEVYNDLDSALVAFFRTLRNPERAAKLKELLDMTPYAREEWAECKAGWRTAPDELELARRWYVTIQQSFSKDGAAYMRAGNSGGWSFTKEPSANPARKWRTAIACLPDFCARLADVQIEHADFADVLTHYDGPNTLFYVDPPYERSSRRAPSHGYAVEFTTRDHERLLDLVTRDVAGMVILSHYAGSALYDGTLADAGWQRVDYETTAYSAGHTAATGIRGKGAAKRTQGRTECVWLNPTCAARLASERRQASLWDGQEASA